jgi:hypothetical protein
MNGKLAISIVAGIVLAIFALTPNASSQMSLGTVSSVSGPQACPSGTNDRGFIPAVGNNCYTAVLTGCPGNDDITFYFGVASPSGTPNGTIVHFAGDGGHRASDGATEITLLGDYVSPANYTVIQIAWGAPAPLDWEVTDSSGGTNPASILNAACRPASFLYWIKHVSSFFTAGKGMCAQGHSAGSAALAYALAWYNAGADLDKAIFTSGPVFSDIRQGCQVPNNQFTLICKPGTNQIGCAGWQLAQEPPPPGYSLEYTTGYKSEVNFWSGNASPISCANNTQSTTASQNANWFQQSILYNLGTQQPSFSYPYTAVSAWLCETVKGGVMVNNAAPEGQLYWAQFTNTAQISSLTVNAITLCPGTEEALDGFAADGNYGHVHVLNDMTDPTVGCKQRHP